MGGFRGPEKRRQTVPTGRVIKYPKKCALFAHPGTPPGGVAPGTPKCTQFWTHSGGHQILIIVVQGIPRTPFLGPILARFSGPNLAHFGRPGAGPPRGGIFRIFRISGISGFPARPGPSPGTPLPGGVAGGSPGTDLARCSRSYNHSTASSTPAVAVRPSYGRVSQA